MKKSKWIAMLVGGAMICSLAACGGQSSSAPASTAAPTEKTADTTAAEAGDTTEAADAVAEDKGEGKGYVIGFSNSYNGNTYRQAMEGYLKEAAEELQKTGEVSEVIFAESNQNNSTQVQQIENFILQGVDAIIIDPGSATALNGAIQEASDAGIPCIIINDGPVSSEAELCYQINFDTIAQMGDSVSPDRQTVGQRRRRIHDTPRTLQASKPPDHRIETRQSQTRRCDSPKAVLHGRPDSPFEQDADRAQHEDDDR